MAKLHSKKVYSAPTRRQLPERPNYILVRFGNCIFTIFSTERDIVEDVIKGSPRTTGGKVEEYGEHFTAIFLGNREEDVITAFEQAGYTLEFEKLP